jgi:4-hydroxy-4-methyl-2-oxoglutarate aldolase
VDVPLVQVVPGSRAAGPARTVRCGQDDNLMVHAAIAEAEPGEVLVVTMPEPRPVALAGELVATQAQVRGVAALLIDAAVRDVEELRELGLPVWARFVRVTGVDKKIPGSIGEPVEVGGATIRQGDVVVLDADGAVVVPQERVDEVLAAAHAGTLREAWGTGTAAVISPVGELAYKGRRMVINGGRIGPLTQRLYDAIVAIQYGKAPDPDGWTLTI